MQRLTDLVSNIHLHPLSVVDKARGVPFAGMSRSLL